MWIKRWLCSPLITLICSNQVLSLITEHELTQKHALGMWTQPPPGKAGRFPYLAKWGLNMWSPKRVFESSMMLGVEGLHWGCKCQGRKAWSHLLPLGWESGGSGTFFPHLSLLLASHRPHADCRWEALLCTVFPDEACHLKLKKLTSIYWVLVI